MNIEEILAYLRYYANGRIEDKENEQVLQSLKSLKSECVNKLDEDEAKNIWCLEQVLIVQSSYLKAFEQMKGCAFYDAWCTLEVCENHLAFLSRHFFFDDDIHDIYYLKFIKKHIRQYQCLYPYALYSSPGFLIIEKRCTICNKIVSIRNLCEHTVGEIYGGEMCGRLITKAELLEISLVENPVQKYSVLFPNTDEKGNAQDHKGYTLLKQLLKRLDSPFENWDVEITKVRHPHSRYKDHSINDICPCGSQKKYKECCLKEPGVLRPHYQFTFSKPKPFDLINKIEYI